MWTIIVRDEDEEDYDVIPSGWIRTPKSCYYPQGKLSYVKHLVKHNANYDPEWEICEISVVESNISDYELAMKMMFRAAKKMSLLSDDEKGRGLRPKKPNKRHDNDNADDEAKEPPTNLGTTKSDRRVPNYPKMPSPNPEEEVLTSPRHGTASFDEQCRNKHQCQMKQKHHCSFEGEDLLVSIAHQLCRLSVDISKIKTNIKYLKEDRATTSHTQEVEEKGEEEGLFILPINTEDEFKHMATLLGDPVNIKKLISLLLKYVDGKSMPKVVGSIMTSIISNDLACTFSWKGQKNKKPFQVHELAKAVIETASKKFPTESRSEIIKSIQLWLAQSPARCKRAQEAAKRVTNVL